MRKLFFTSLLLIQISTIKTMDFGLCAGQQVEYNNATNFKPNESTVNDDSSINEKSSMTKSLADEIQRLDDEEDREQFTGSLMYLILALAVYLYYDYHQFTTLPSYLKDNIYGNIYNQHFIPEE